MIVQMAAPLSNSPFENYAVLGDDIILEDSLRVDYLHLIKTLGVEIQLTKSLIGDRCVEFAKRLINLNKKSWVDYSVIGPKLIIGAINRPIFRINILIELLRKNVFFYYEIRDRLIRLPGKNAKYFKSIGLSALSLSGNTTYVTLKTAYKNGVFDLMHKNGVVPAAIKSRDLIGSDSSGTTLQYLDHWVYFDLVTEKYTKVYLKAIASVEEPFLFLLNTRNPREFISHVLTLLSPYSTVLTLINADIALRAIIELYLH